MEGNGPASWYGEADGVEHGQLRVLHASARGEKMCPGTGCPSQHQLPTAALRNGSWAPLCVDCQPPEQQPLTAWWIHLGWGWMTFVQPCFPKYTCTPQPERFFPFFFSCLYGLLGQITMYWWTAKLPYIKRVIVKVNVFTALWNL